MNQNDTGLPNSQIKPPSTLTPTGFVHSLKGQLLDIAFLDINGNLIPQNLTDSSSSYNKRQTYHQSGQAADDIADLDIDFSYLASNTLGNSIAENFGGATSSAGGTTSSVAALSGLNDNSTSSSPTTNSEDLFGSSFGSKSSSKTKKLLSATKSSKMMESTKDQTGANVENPDSALSSNKVLESKQFAILTSENQIKVIALPTQTCIHKYAISEGQVARASVVVINC
jgi:hypothetical protein